MGTTPVSDVCPLSHSARASTVTITRVASGWNVPCVSVSVYTYIQVPPRIPSTHRVYTQQLPIYFVKFWMRARDTIQTRGGRERTTLCALPAIFSYFSFSMLATLSGTVLEDGWLWPRMEGGGKKADLFWSTERNSSARIAISLHGPLNGRAEKERVRLCRQDC